MMPTSPLRNIQKIEKMTEELAHTYCVSSVMPTNSHRLDLLELDDFGFFKSSSKISKYSGLSLKTLGSYHGINNVKTLKEPRQYVYFMIENFMETLDIDIESDLKTLRYIVDNSLYDFGANLWN